MAGSGLANLVGGGFVAQGNSYTQERADQGRDLTTTPGGPVVAPGEGYLIRNGYDPNGFGPRYPIVHFNTGPYANQDIYIGHTLSALEPGAHFSAGAVLSHTGATGNESWNGNATQPGWAEIGFAPGGSPGAFGQPTPFGGQNVSANPGVNPRPGVGSTGSMPARGLTAPPGGISGGAPTLSATAQAAQGVSSLGQQFALHLVNSAQQMMSGGTPNLSQLFAAAKGFQQAKAQLARTQAPARQAPLGPGTHLAMGAARG